MKLVKSLLLGSAAGLVAAAGAQAADLPTRKSAPVEYVRICDAYGAGFFYIPGTDTCLKIGGLVLAEERIFNNTYSIGGNYQGSTHLASPTSYIPGISSSTLLSNNNYQNARNRDVVGTAVLGRVELDARNATAWGTLRAFVRVDAFYGSALTASTGSPTTQTFESQNIGNVNVSRETTIINKAFIQFAGLTAGWAQSYFDFYADAYNFEGLRDSNTTTGLFAYTATFGGGFSGTLSVEDQVQRRTTYGTVIGDIGPTGIVGAPFSGTTPSATNGGTRMPDIVANIRIDQPWGAAQISGAAHELEPTLYNPASVGAGGIAIPIPGYSKNYFGYAALGGIMFNLPMLAPGDKLWFEGAYAHGAVAYTNGSNLAFFGGVDLSRNGGTGLAGGVSGGNNWQRVGDEDCIYTATGQCELTNSFYALAALKHYWIPTVSQAFFVNYYGVRYSNNAVNPYNSAFGNASVAGMVNYDEYRVGTNLTWTPIPGFDIAGEADWLHGVNRNRPYGLASDATLVANGLPAWQATTNVFEGRIRVQRAF